MSRNQGRSQGGEEPVVAHSEKHQTWDDFAREPEGGRRWWVDSGNDSIRYEIQRKGCKARFIDRMTGLQMGPIMPGVFPCFLFCEYHRLDPWVPLPDGVAHPGPFGTRYIRYNPAVEGPWTAGKRGKTAYSKI